MSRHKAVDSTVVVQGETTRPIKRKETHRCMYESDIGWR